MLAVFLQIENLCVQLTESKIKTILKINMKNPIFHSHLTFLKKDSESTILYIHVSNKHALYVALENEKRLGERQGTCAFGYMSINHLSKLLAVW